MGREVRRVPADWTHPRYPDDYYRDRLRGRYIGMHESGGYAESAADWDAGHAKWRKGLCRSYDDGPKWVPIESEYVASRYTEYAGERPSPDDYMPDWPEAERTHLMMYETTSEGTPISPALETPEELARWLADSGASSFGGITASYEAWLNVARGGYAPSMVISDDGMQSGVEASLAYTSTN